MTMLVPSPTPPTTADRWNRPALPRMRAHDAAWRRRLHQARISLPFSLGAHALSLSLASPRELAVAGSLPIRLQLRLGDGTGQICLGAPLARLLLDTLAPRLPTDHPDLDLLLEAALTEPLDALERLFGHPLAFLPLDDKSPADLQAIGIRIHRGNVVLGLALLRLGSAEAALLADVLDRLPPEPNAMGRLTCAVTAAAGFTVLPLATLRQLRRGDIVLTDDVLDDGVARIVVAGQYAATGQKAGGGYEITTPLQEIAAMAEQSGELTERSLDDLRVQIVFEMGRLELPLAELQKIRPGYVLELDRPATLGVDLMVRGQVIGKAELVQIDNTLGARVLRLFEHD